MVGIESTMDLAESAKKAKKSEVSEAERERQREFLKSLSERPDPRLIGGGTKKVRPDLY